MNAPPTYINSYNQFGELYFLASSDPGWTSGVRLTLDTNFDLKEGKLFVFLNFVSFTCASGGTRTRLGVCPRSSRWCLVADDVSGGIKSRDGWPGFIQLFVGGGGASPAPGAFRETEKMMRMMKTFAAPLCALLLALQLLSSQVGPPSRLLRRQEVIPQAGQTSSASLTARLRGGFLA